MAMMHICVASYLMATQHNFIMLIWLPLPETTWWTTEADNSNLMRHAHPRILYECSPNIYTRLNLNYQEISTDIWSFENFVGT